MMSSVDGLALPMAVVLAVHGSSSCRGRSYLSEEQVRDRSIIQLGEESIDRIQRGKPDLPVSVFETSGDGLLEEQGSLKDQAHHEWKSGVGHVVVQWRQQFPEAMGQKNKFVNVRGFDFGASAS